MADDLAVSQDDPVGSVGVQAARVWAVAAMDQPFPLAA